MKRIDLGSQVQFNFWESRLITDELIRAAAEDPALWQGQADKIANFDVNLRNGALAWQEGAQLMLKEVANTSGVPANLANSIMAGVTELYRGRPTSVKELGINLANAGIGIVTNALAAVPIVGQVAGAIGALASMLISLAQDSPQQAAEFLPPLQDYSDEVDEWVVNNQVLPASGTLDWTGLFLPRYKGTWRAYPREHGWAMRASAGGGGVGFMPGTERINGIIQTYFVYKSVRKGFQLSQARDQGSFYPGAAQMLTALIEQSERPQTQLYNVDTHRIEKEWREHMEGAVDLAKAIWNRNKAVLSEGKMGELTEEQARSIVQAMMSPLSVGAGDQIGGAGTYSWKPWQQGRDVFNTFIKPWCELVRQRQMHHVGTIVGTAYTSEDQAAFQGDQQLLLKLRINRGLLLDSPWKRKVVLADMIDPAYKQQMFDATIGSTFTAQLPPPSQPLDPNVPPDSAPQPPGGGPPFGGVTQEGGAGRFLVGAALLAGLGYLARKKGLI